MRIQHRLKKNKTTQIPQRFLFFDTETTQEKIDKNTIENKFRLGYGVRWERPKKGRKEIIDWFSFKTVKMFWDCIEAVSYKKQKLVVVAHNIQFDFQVLNGFNELKERNWKNTKLILNDNVNIWEFKKDSKTLLFLDNFNYFRMSLRQLGDDLGLPKMVMPDFKDNDQVWFRYCKRDVEILLKAWQEWVSFIQVNDLGSFGLTLASQALHSFRHRFMDHNIYIHNNPKATLLERQSYFGGRTECFYIGKLPKQPYYNLDINSMYPFVMKTKEYPTNLETTTKNIGIIKAQNLLKKYLLTARVRVETPEPVFPTRHKNKVCFPVGSFWTTLSSPELKYGLEKKYIKEIKEVNIYNKAKIFESYVNFFYNKRLEYKKSGNKSFAFASKLFLNTLYGKFGQRNETFKKIGYNPKYEDEMFTEYDAETKTINTYRIMDGVIEKSIGKVDSYNTFVAISAHITAEARLYLWQLINQAGIKNVYYTDTDSLFVNQKGLDNLSDMLSEKDIGKLKIEYFSDKLEIRNLKDYVFGETERLKGIKPSAKKIGKNKYEQWEFQRIRSALRGRGISKQVMIRVNKELKRDYTKGIVKKNGRVIPYTLKI